MTPQLHRVDNLGNRMADLLKASIQQERERVRFRYDHACEMAENAVVNDFTIPSEDMQQRIFDYKKLLWEIYEPELKECSRFLRMANTLRDDPERA